MAQPLNFDLVCFSDLRWNYLFDRPQHLMSHAAQSRRVYFFEDPVFTASRDAINLEETPCGVIVARPHVIAQESEADKKLTELMKEFFAQNVDPNYVLWYYSKKAVQWTRELSPISIVYDCVSDLSAQNDSQLSKLEDELFKKATLVFAGGQSLYEAKFDKHPHVYPFPNRVELGDFEAARVPHADPPDQSRIPHPRLGFYGRIDKRLDLELISKVAADKPEWQLVFIGPIEMESNELPQGTNIHYLGLKEYSELPAYIAGWDVAIIPFAETDSTRTLNPTKTAEYLASATPVVSTPIPDVVRPFSLKGLVRIADNSEKFVESCQSCIDSGSPVDQEYIDNFLHLASWDDTWNKMAKHLKDAVNSKLTGQKTELDRDFRELGSRLGTNP